MTAPFDFHPEAAVDLDEIAEYIAADNPDAAERVTEEILSALAMLATNPQMGHRRPKLTGKPLRFWLVGNYLIAYAPDEQPLWVLALFHTRRSPRVMAAILRSREERPSKPH